MQVLYNNILQAIGNTPLVKLSKIVPENCADIYVKLEYFNPTGSYKDRMAMAIIEEAEARGDIYPGKLIVEYTGGSTGTSLAFVCAIKGYALTLVSSDAFAQEKLKRCGYLAPNWKLLRRNQERSQPLFLQKWKIKLSRS